MKKFLVLCIITGIVIFYLVKIDTPKLIAFMLSPLDHTFTGEINTKDYQYYGDLGESAHTTLIYDFIIPPEF